MSHFSILSPVTRLLARKILADTGPTPTIDVRDDELASAVKTEL